MIISPLSSLKTYMYIWYHLLTDGFPHRLKSAKSNFLQLCTVCLKYFCTWNYNKWFRLWQGFHIFILMCVQDMVFIHFVMYLSQDIRHQSSVSCPFSCTNKKSIKVTRLMNISFRDLIYTCCVLSLPTNSCGFTNTSFLFHGCIHA